MIQYSVDRFEEDQAILIDDQGNVTLVQCSILPNDITEGDIISFDGNKYCIDSAATLKKRAQVKALIDELFI